MLVGGHGLTGTEAFGARLRAGRLVELHVAQLRDRPDVVAFCAQVDAATACVPGDVVFCADYRYAHAFASSVAEYWAQAMRRYNKRIARSAILLSHENATFNLQMERMVRVVHNPDRRVFYETAELRDWLAEVLTPEESEELESFLGIDAPSGVRPRA
jgi:hypothetical protein